MALNKLAENLIHATYRLSYNKWCWLGRRDQHALYTQQLLQQPAVKEDSANPWHTAARLKRGQVQSQYSVVWELTSMQPAPQTSCTGIDHTSFWKEICIGV
jgi:hypothetical protein